MFKNEMNFLQEWIDNTRVYPPNHIYQGMAQGKQEKQAMAVCEEIYKFNFGDKKNFLGDLHLVWHEFHCFVNVYLAPPFIEVREEYVNNLCDKLLSEIQSSVSAMDSVFKKHQAVNEYYKSWRISYQDLKAQVLKIKNGVSKNEVLTIL
ncbi:hypothetical protein [Klebsiella phage 05F01]|nr:hypothetical protein [Klebsiella phage 05F01]